MKSEGLLSATQLPIRYAKIFFRRKWLLLIPAVIAIVAGIVIGALLPKTYQSYSVVMIEEEKTLNPLISGIAVSSDVISRMRNIREQILGWNSLVQLVERLHLAKDVKSQYDFEQLVLELRRRINVRMQGPNLIKISYTSGKPTEAKKVVQTVNDIFVEENMKAQNRESTIAIVFLKDQIKVYRRKIAEAEIADMGDKLDDLLIDSTEAHPLVMDYRRKIADMEFPGWGPGTDEDNQAMFANVIDALAADMETPVDDDQPAFILDNLWVEEGGGCVELSGWLTIDGDTREIRAGYGDAGPKTAPSLRWFAEYRTDVRVIAGAFAPPVGQAAGYDGSSRAVH